MNANPNSRNKVLFLLLTITLIGAMLRVIAITTTTVDSPIRADARIYYFSALNIERWNIFSSAAPGEQAPQPDAFVPPGLPYAMSAFVTLPPTQKMIWRINLAQAALGTLTILMTFAFFSLFTSPTVALGAALLTAISPHLIVMTTYLLTETLFTFLVVAALLALALAFKKTDWKWAIGAGGLLGLGALTRETTEYLPVLMLPVLYLAAERRAFVRVVVPAALAALAVILAWKVRNLLSIGHFSDPALLNSTILHGMYPNFMFNDIAASHGMPYRFDPFAQQKNDIGGILSELQRRAAAQPATYLYWYFIGKPISLLSWEMIDGIGDIFIYPITASPYLTQPFFKATRLIAFIVHAPLSIAAVIGSLLAVLQPGLLGLTGNQRLPAILVALMLGYFFAIHIIGAPFPRYGIPLRPLVYGFGLFTMVALFQTFAALRSDRKCL